MDLRFTTDGIFNLDDEKNTNGEIQAISTASDVTDTDFSNVVQIIDESGNEINCTVDKFIEIFDKQGLEGFIL